MNTDIHVSGPLVSICVPTYNGAEFLLDALKSAASQTYRPLEIIISDDNSQDETLAIVKDFAAQTDIPVHIHHHTPSGIGENWNNCVRLANGKYIKFLFQDDLLEPSCVEKMVAIASQDDDIGLVFSGRNFSIDGDPAAHQRWLQQYGDLPSYWQRICTIQHGTDLLKDINFLEQPKNKVGEPTTVLLKKAVFDKVGYFRQDLKQSLDYEYWYRVFKHFKVGYIDEKLVTFRLHEKQATAQNRKLEIPDYDLYPKIIYQELFWQLHPQVRKRLFMKYNPLGRFLSKLTS